MPGPSSAIGVSSFRKYRLSYRFAHRPAQLLLNHLEQLEGRKSQKDSRLFVRLRFGPFEKFNVQNLGPAAQLT